MRFSSLKVLVLAVLLAGAIGSRAAEPAASAAGPAWSDLSTVTFDGAFGLKLGEVIEPPAGLKPGDLDVGLRFPMTPKTPLPPGLRGTILVMKKSHKLVSILLEAKMPSDAELTALKGELTKKFGPPGPDVLGSGLPTWQKGARSLSLDRMPSGIALTWTDIRLTSEAMDEK